MRSFPYASVSGRGLRRFRKGDRSRRTKKTRHGLRLVLEVLEDRTLLDFTAALTGTNVVFAGDGANDVLAFDAVEGLYSDSLLRHNRFDAGDAGFASAQDFDSVMAGDQTLANTASANVTVNAGGGDDFIALGRNQASTPDIPAASVNAYFTINGEGQENAVPGDTVAINNVFDTTGRTVNLSSGQITGYGGGFVLYSNIELVAVNAGTGADTINLLSTGPRTFIDAGSGNDRVSLKNGATTNGGGISGGPGFNTLDYGAYTTAVNAELGDLVNLNAIIAPENEVPANDTDAEGVASMTFNPVTKKFSLTVMVFNMTRAELTGSHIHAESFGVNGGIIVDLGGGMSWTEESGFPFGAFIQRTITNADFPAEHVEALLRTNTYVNVHTVAFPGGEIRGQLLVTGGGGGTGSGDPALDALGLEGVGIGLFNHVIGGAGNDILQGNSSPNNLSGNGGDDSLHGGNGSDTLLGGIGNDTVQGAIGHDSVDAGLGNDVLIGGRNNDTLNGNTGTDLLLESFDVNLVLTDTSLTGDLGSDTLLGIEKASLTGGVSNNSLNALAFSGPTTIIGGLANDALKGGKGADSLDGGPGNDVLIGGPGNDTINGGAGIDKLQESANVNFTLTSSQLTGLGTDTLIAMNVAQLTGGGGNNLIRTSSFGGSVTVNGGGGNDTILSGSGGDLILGGEGNDSISGGAGNDTINAGTGTDTVNGGAGTDSCVAGEGVANCEP